MQDQETAAPAEPTDDQLREKLQQIRNQVLPPQTSDSGQPLTFLQADGRCKTCRAEVPEGVGICPECDAKAKAYWRARSDRDRQESIARQLAISGLPRAYRAGERTVLDVPSTRADVLTLCQDLGTPEVMGLFLFGDSKTFKTTIAAAWLAAVVKDGGIGRYVDTVDLMSDIQRSYRDDDYNSRAEIVDRYALTPALVLDDLGQEKASHHAGEVLRQILDRRRRDWRKGCWLIVTSNRTPEGLRDRFEERETGNAILHRLAQLTIAVPMGAS